MFYGRASGAFLVQFCPTFFAFLSAIVPFSVAMQGDRLFGEMLLRPIALYI